MKPRPQLSRRFAAGALFAETEQGLGMLLTVSADFDVLRTTLEAQLGRSHTPLQDSPWGEGRSWAIQSEKHYNYVLDTFFKPAVPREQLRLKPNIHAIRLVPIDLDRPIIPNNWGDVK